jgi:outer membrane protein assembly factor BamB
MAHAKALRVDLLIDQEMNCIASLFNLTIAARFATWVHRFIALAVASASVTLAVARTAEGSSAPLILWRHATENSSWGGVPSAAIDSDGSIYGTSVEQVLYALQPDGSEKWRFKTGGTIWSDLAVGADGTVYVASEALYALTADGAIKWKIACTDVQEQKSAPAIGRDGEVYFVCGHNLVAVDVHGSVLWKCGVDTSQWISLPPVIARDGTIYLRTGRRIYAFRPDGTIKWERETRNSAVPCSPAINHDGTLLFNDRDEMVALDGSGEVKWRFKMGGISSSTPAIGKEHVIYFGSFDHHLYAVTSGGELKWEYDAGAPITASPAVDAEENIYFTSKNGRFHCVAAGGKRRWMAQFGAAGCPIIAKDGTIYLADLGYIYAIEGSTPPSTGPWPMKRHDSAGTGRAAEFHPETP